MKMLDVLLLFFHDLFLVHQPVVGMNQRNWCSATMNCTTLRPQQPKDSSLVFSTEAAGRPSAAELHGNVLVGTFCDGSHHAESWSVTHHTCSGSHMWSYENVLTDVLKAEVEKNCESDFDSSRSVEVNASLMARSTRYDHQNIVALEADPVVMESASSLFNKHPLVSTLLRFHNGALQVIRGSQVRLTGDSRVVLVGHGSRGSDETARLGGYEPEEVARVVGDMEMEGGHIQTLSLVGCELGRDRQFAMRLLQALRALHVETKLHLRSSALSIGPSGEKVTRVEGGVWRHKDSSKKVIAQLDQRGNLLIRMEEGKRGQVMHNYQGHSLYRQTLEWPTHPQMFVPADLRKKYTSIDCLEGLTWSLFFEENEKRRAPNYIPGEDLSAVWLNNQEPERDTPIRHITTILDLVREIRYNAREDVDVNLYYVLNNYIYKVQKRTFHASLVGKYINPDGLSDIQKFIDAFEAQTDHYTLHKLSEGLRASEFIEFCRQTFQFRQCQHDCDRWGRYFMVAVFSASVQNFRTFSLFLMSIIACEVSRLQGTDNSICTAFVGDDYPMAAADLWPVDRQRGFYGCTGEETTKRDRVAWVDQVLAKENALYTRSKEMMTGIDHDQETELDIFGKVKVMNGYVFASYIESFRGTLEGKRLARGCVGPQKYDTYE